MRLLRDQALSVLVLGLAASLAGAQEPDPARVEKILDQARQIQKDVEALRGLPYRTDVPKGVQTRDAMRDFVVGNMRREFAKPESKESEAVLKIFGFVPADFDFGEGLAEFYGSQIGGYYDPEAKRLFLIDEPGKAPAAGQELNDGFVMAHELGHALQDQHFDLSRFTVLFKDNEDMTFAFKSLVEGEATIVGFKWLAGKNPMLGRMSVRRLMALNKQMAERMQAQGEGPKIPPYIRDVALFPYEGGAGFVERAIEAKGWSAVNGLFANPPISTEQVLHPEKYFTDKPDLPKQIWMVKFEETLGDGYRETNNNTLGELQIRLLLQALGCKPEQAESAAAGWGGDRYQALIHKESKQPVVIWLTSWDSEAEAQEFYSIYREALARRYEGKDHELVLQRRGHRVLLVEGARPADRLQIIRKAFESGETPVTFKVPAEMLVPPPLSDFEEALRGDPTAVVAEGPLVEDTDVMLSFRLPGEGWERTEEDIRALAQFSRLRYRNADKTREMRLLELPLEYDEKQMGRRLEGMLRQGIKDVEKKLEESFKVGDRPAMRVDLEGIIPGEEKKARVSVVAIGYEASTLVFLFRALPEQWDEAGLSYRGVIASLRLGKAVKVEAIQRGERLESEGSICSLVLPQDWRARNLNLRANEVLAFEDKAGARAVATFHPSQGKSGPFWGVAGEDLARQLYEGYERVGVSLRTFSGSPGTVLDFRAKSAQGMIRQRLITIRFTNGHILQLALTCPESRMAEYKGLFAGLTDGFEILNPEADMSELPKPEPEPEPKPEPKPVDPAGKPKARLY